MLVPADDGDNVCLVSRRSASEFGESAAPRLGAQIEDVWLPYFAVATDVDRAGQGLYHAPRCAVESSACVRLDPCVLPPMFTDNLRHKASGAGSDLCEQKVLAKKDIGEQVERSRLRSSPSVCRGRARSSVHRPFRYRSSPARPSAESGRRQARDRGRSRD